MLNRRTRELFDREFERVMKTLPAAASALLKEIAVAVEDYPSDDILAEMDAERDELCGLYTGIPATERSVQDVGSTTDLIHIYRLGLLSLATAPNGAVDIDELREQILITLLHEIGHHHGLEDDDLEDLGY